jgi:hypothetical protein
MWSIIAARVVDFPVPVAPVTSTRDDPEDPPHRTALQEDVCPKAPQSVDTERDVQLERLLELGDLLRRENGVDDLLGHVGGHHLVLGGDEGAVDPDLGRGTCRHMQV